MTHAWIKLLITYEKYNLEAEHSCTKKTIKTVDASLTGIT